MTYGCHNHGPRAETLDVQDGWSASPAVPKVQGRVMLPVHTRWDPTPCVYTLTHADDEDCGDCRHRKGR